MKQHPKFQLDHLLWLPGGRPLLWFLHTLPYIHLGADLLQTPICSGVLIMRSVLALCRRQLLQLPAFLSLLLCSKTAATNRGTTVCGNHDACRSTPEKRLRHTIAYVKHSILQRSRDAIHCSVVLQPDRRQGAAVTGVTPYRIASNGLIFPCPAAPLVTTYEARLRPLTCCAEPRSHSWLLWRIQAVQPPPPLLLLLAHAVPLPQALPPSFPYF
jgi:hypothetical protein